MSPVMAIGVVAALSLSGFVQGLTGFGFGLVSVAILPLLLGLKDALVVVAFLNVVVCAATFAATWRQFRWRSARGLIIGSCIGVPIGFWGLVELDAGLLLRALGILLCIFSAIELIFGERSPIKIPAGLGFPVGIVSGGIGGALNVGGPPAIAYVYSQAWSKAQVVAVLQVVFGLNAVLRAVLVGTSELVRPSLVHISLMSIVPMLLATLGGGWFLGRIPDDTLRRAVFGFLFIMGIKYLVCP